jgi:hypothetical protein
MAKLIVHFGKKLPVGEFSNQQFCASIEAECDAESPDDVRSYFRRLFAVAKQAVEEQFAGAPVVNGASTAAQPTTVTSQPRNGWRVSATKVTTETRTNGNGRHVPATPAQKKAVFAIAKSLGLDPGQFNVESLGLKEASALIDNLKSQQPKS